MAAYLGRCERDESPARALRALDLRLEARPGPPFVGAAWRPPRPSRRLRTLPPRREHVGSSVEQRPKQRYPPIGGPDVGSACRSPHRRDLPDKRCTLVIKRVQPRLRFL